MNIYIEGFGGLGNCLFQIATGIYYREKYKSTLYLKKNSYPLEYGTSNKFNRKKNRIINNKDISYTETIFRKFIYYENNSNDLYILHNDYTDNKIIQTKDILIKGYCQNINLFKEYLPQIQSSLSKMASKFNNIKFIS